MECKKKQVKRDKGSVRQFPWDLKFSRTKRWKREQDRGVEVVADEEGKVGRSSLDEGRRVKLTRVSLVQLLDFPWEKSKKKRKGGKCTWKSGEDF